MRVVVVSPLIELNIYLLLTMTKKMFRIFFFYDGHTACILKYYEIKNNKMVVRLRVKYRLYIIMLMSKYHQGG